MTNRPTVDIVCVVRYRSHYFCMHCFELFTETTRLSYLEQSGVCNCCRCDVVLQYDAVFSAEYVGPGADS